jgi:phosphoadenosine phosphosulfate reductase
LFPVRSPDSVARNLTDLIIFIGKRGRGGQLQDLDELNRRFETAPATDIVAWATQTYGARLCLTTSFTDTLLIDLATGVAPDVEVVFCDTGFHFPDTYDTLRRAQVRYGLNLTVLRPADDRLAVWADGPDVCCGLRKVEPLDRHLRSSRDAWMSGLRRADSAERAATPIVHLDRRGLVKVNPIATWTDADVEAYLADHDIIVNPLVSQGYPSIGCWPCTVPSTGDDARSGRWAGLAKSECGLHV